MKILHGLETLEPPLAQSVLTIGNFDGVHRAHQQLLAQAGLFAANTGGPVVVLTFEPHPLTVVAPAHAPPRLSTLEDKLRYLDQAGAELVVIARSEPALLSLEPEEFVERIIIQRFHPTHIVEGPSFGFGKGRRGTPESLRLIAAPFGSEVHIVEPVTLEIDEGAALLVSSSLIRRLIKDGKVRRAGLCLGRSYALTGKVVRGDGRGRTLGAATANLDVNDRLLPGDGVFAGTTVFAATRYLTAISIGTNPTFAGSQRRIEAHLLDFDGDLYDHTIRIEFDRRLRGQQAFASSNALADQLRRDIEAVRRGADAPADRESSEQAKAS